MSSEHTDIRWPNDRDQALGMAKPWNPLACGSDVRISARARIPDSDLTLRDDKGRVADFLPRHPRPGDPSTNGKRSQNRYTVLFFVHLPLMDRPVDHCVITKRNGKRTVIIAIESQIDKHHQNSAQMFHCGRLAGQGFGFYKPQGRHIR
jgi:hypothetical protein